MRPATHFSNIVLGLALISAGAIAEPAAPALDPLADAAVFRTIVRRQGDDGVHTYRIPGLATTTKGTLVAVFDLRHASERDLPGDIDVAISRSTDDGKTWGKSQVILDFDKNEKDARGNGVGDPAILVDRKTGHLIAIALWSHGNRGWITVRDHAKTKKLVSEAVEVNKSQSVPDWLQVRADALESEVMTMPRRDHVPHPIQEQLIIELCSK